MRHILRTSPTRSVSNAHVEDRASLPLTRRAISGELKALKRGLELRFAIGVFSTLMISLGPLFFMGCEDLTSLSVSESENDHENDQDLRSPPLTSWSCAPQQATPYPAQIPYVGIHGNAANNDFIDCETPGKWRRAWHALRGLGMTQPNTFSPDGQVTYLTSTNPEPDGCRLFALSVESGQYLWCKSYPTKIERASVEVDEDGHLYFTVDDALISLSASGDERWSVRLESIDGRPAGGWGVHFTPQGHVATVTSSGRVYLINRMTGDTMTTFDIASVWPFVSPETFGVDLDPSSLLPESVQADIRAVWGAPSDEEQAAGFGALLGSGEFVDNTVGISARGDIYVIGGGPTPQQGAVVQLRMGGTPDAPTLSAGWYAVTHKGSATTPSISPGDRYMVIGDGAHPSTFLNPEGAQGAVKVYDIDLCDRNEDADPNPEICGLDWSHPLERAPMVGAPAILADGTVILWEMGLTFDAPPSAPDVVAVNRDGVIWASALPDDMDWSSVVTVTRNHVIGSASRVTPSTQGLPGFKLPIETEDRVVVLDRQTGALVWHHTLPDDCAATVTVGPDGSLYVPMLGIFSILAIDERPTLGLIRFIPDETAPNSAPLIDAETLERQMEETQEAPPSGGGSMEMSIPETIAGDDMMEADPSDQRCFAVELNALPTCCDEGPARCVEGDLIPEGFASLLSDCGQGGLCVPESILSAENAIAPVTCSSIGGVPGACLSRCLPTVAQNAALLPQDICASDEICIPCVSPLDGMDTGACGEISCGAATVEDSEGGAEAGGAEMNTPEAEGGAQGGQSTEPPDSPPSCCAGHGTCLSPDLVPEEQNSSLKNCRREGHRELMCVRNDFLDPSWIPQRCMGSSLLSGDYEGVCLSDCLRLPFEFTLDRTPCAEGYVCTPCVRPLSGEPSGAPGCEMP